MRSNTVLIGLGEVRTTPFSGSVNCPQDRSRALERQGYYQVQWTTDANASGYLRNGFYQYSR